MTALPRAVYARQVDADPADIAEKIAALRLEHRDLNATIARLAGDTEADELQMKRLKKRKLMLKDKIYQLERMLVPDVPA